MVYKFVLAVVAGLILAERAGAADCLDRAITNPELDECAAEKLKEADGVLEMTYRHYLATLDVDGARLLKAAQDAWTAFRAADCRATADRYRGGRIEAMSEDFCKAGLARDRIADLKAIYEEPPMPSVPGPTPKPGTH